MASRARSVLTRQSSGCAYHGQACAQCYNAALTMVRPAKTKRSSGCGCHGQACAPCQGEAVVRACNAGLREKVHAVERCFKNKQNGCFMRAPTRPLPLQKKLKQKGEQDLHHSKRRIKPAGDVLPPPGAALRAGTTTPAARTSGRPSPCSGCRRNAWRILRPSFAPSRPGSAQNGPETETPPEKVMWVWAKIEPPGIKPQVFVHVSICQGSILST